MASIVILLVGSSIIVACTSQLQPQQPYTKSTIEAVISVLQASYVDRASTLTIRHASNAVNYKRFKTGAFVDAVLAGLRSQHLIVTVDDGRSVRTHAAPSVHNAFFVDGYDAFRSIYKNLHYTQYDFTGFYTIVLTRSTRYQYEIITSILNDCWLLHITNVIVLVAVQSRAQTAMYTYFPFTSYHCELVRPVILTYHRINDDDRLAFKRSDFFPPKALNMHGCAVSLAIFRIVPYIWVRIVDGIPLLDGFEGAVMLSLAKRLNFTVVVRSYRDDVSGGVIYANGTGTGVLGMLLRNEVNISVGALQFRTDRKLFLSPSTPYFQDSIVLVVPKGRSYTAMEKLFMPFERDLWIRIGVVLSGAGVLIAILRRRADALAFVAGPRNRSPFMNMVAILLGDSLMPTMPARNFARYVLMVWTLGSLVVRTAYQSALFHFVQTPMEAAPIERLDDLLAANYALRMAPERFSVFDDIAKAKPHLRPTAHANNSMEFEQLINRPTYRDAYITLSMIAGFYNHHHIDRTVHVARERLFSVSGCMYFRKHSCISNSFNGHLDQLFEKGWLKKWQKQFVDWEMLRRATQEKGNTSVRPLRIDEVLGAFQICACWLLVSAAVFGLEFMSLRWVPLGRLFD